MILQGRIISIETNGSSKIMVISNDINISDRVYWFDNKRSVIIENETSLTTVKALGAYKILGELNKEYLEYYSLGDTIKGTLKIINKHNSNGGHTTTNIFIPLEHVTKM